jgi:hypothetical protein
MTDDDVILPCPFCGQPPIVDERGVGKWADDATTYIQCTHHSCGVNPKVYAYHPFRYEKSGKMVEFMTHEAAQSEATDIALKRWNKRSPVVAS